MSFDDFTCINIGLEMLSSPSQHSALKLLDIVNDKALEARL